ncbi:PTS sugar transporter subunit IIA [Desulforamulus hydrothermalis]|uniref:Putative PTS IIA-like nitrogen-regulatory protein PtsN n=1 Tax=Desulforamulus hydrothermalis Lam5 = DSM 18033 TaxID=1121428 RepID=K8E7L4_9FIRM|nr:fructose PTS transporter subunit IIA [Desulforamulus hydrothermalis]CCO07508.1 putative PTS IIA-like nitrogen-regulatory protein PtsN [Desulforamulus hydrothermalis Lam5 = DSM 18033]SHH16921.1 PTS system, fructose-specific IIA component [Desulforamulus hydrothermalis Lam5 = DSM 18033]
MKLAGIINKETIQLSLAVSNKQECIAKMVEQMVKTGAVTNQEDYIQTVLEREQKGTTGVGFGVAIPHGKSAGVVRPALGFAKLAQPVDWQSLDGQPVSLVFLIAVPAAQAGNEHLQILAAIARQLMHQEFRNRLYEAKSPEEVMQALETI